MKNHVVFSSFFIQFGGLSFFILSYWINPKSYAYPSQVIQHVASDSVAERMLLYQRNNGGWPQPNGDPINYNKAIEETLKQKLLSEKNNLDATIDDQATTREIKSLVTAYKKTQNIHYLHAAEGGIRYLIMAQNAAGGWGQFYPDTSSYHKHITYNDNAMIDVMWILKYIVEGKNDFEVIDPSLIPLAKVAMARGIDCILKTQFVQNGTLTAWCAQHDRQTLLPAKARAFELPSLSGNETVGIVQFLMSIDKPTPPIKQAIQAAVNWLEASKIVGIRVDTIQDSTQPKGRDRIVVADPSSTLWARFYDLKTNKPFFTGRNSSPKSSLAEIENERRVGYAYYGSWPAQLLSTDYAVWLKKWVKN